MLARLTVRRFVFIEEATAEFEGGFCVLTGETGAGKSLLVDALSLLAGGRADHRMIMPGAESFEAEAAFAHNGEGAVADFLRQHDLLDDDGEMIVRRVVGKKIRGRLLTDGKRRCHCWRRRPRRRRTFAASIITIQCGGRRRIGRFWIHLPMRFPKPTHAPKRIASGRMPPTVCIGRKNRKPKPAVFAILCRNRLRSWTRWIFLPTNGMSKIKCSRA